MTVLGDHGPTPESVVFNIFAVVSSAAVVLTVVTATFLTCCKTKQQKLEITETGDRIPSRDPDICHHRVKDVEAVVATRSGDVIEKLVKDLKAQKSSGELGGVTAEKDNAWSGDGVCDMTEERIYEYIDDVAYDLRDILQTTKSQTDTTTRLHATQTAPAVDTSTQNDSSPFVYEYLDQYIDVTHTRGVDNPGFLFNATSSTINDYPSQPSVSREFPTTEDWPENYRGDEVCLYDFPGQISEETGMNKSTVDTKDDATEAQTQHRRLSIVELERLENERRERQFTNERVQLDTHKVFSHTSTAGIKEHYSKNRNSTHSALTTSQAANTLPTTVKSKQTKIGARMNSEKVKAGNKSEDLSVRVEIPTGKEQNQVGNPQKASTFKKGACNDSKPNKGSVRFKHGFDIIPNVEHEEDESNVKRNIRLASERDLESGMAERLNRASINSDKCIRNTDGQAAPGNIDKADNKEGRHLQNKTVINNDSDKSGYSVKSLKHQWMTNQENKTDKSSGHTDRSPVDTISRQRQTFHNEDTFMRMIPSEETMKSNESRPLSGQRYDSSSISTYSKIHNKTREVQPLGEKPHLDKSTSRGPKTPTTGTGQPTDIVSKQGITNVPKRKQKRSTQDDSTINKSSGTVMVKGVSKPAINYSQTVGVQSGRLVVEREIREMATRENEFRALKGQS